MKQKLKEHKGITLIALIITIIVLLILAAVAIAAIKGDGIISHAKNAKSQYSKAQQDEASMLSGYELTLAEANGKKLDITDAQSSGMLTRTSNTIVYDKYGNKITVPAGFKIITKTDIENTDLNYTADDINVTKGIVVEDGEGNQFVWIPVGKIYTDIEKTEANAKTITLGRYDNFTKINNAYTVRQNANDYKTQIKADFDFTEDTIENHSSSYQNSIAKNIGEFCTKALASGGYYIGRYEARTGTERKSSSTSLTPITSKANDYVYNYITQAQASERCQNMYTNKPFESDLVNSYAWDTAIIFFQEFGDDSTYASKMSVNSSLANTGTSGTNYTGIKDTICNVYDMASNCFEWSTETFSDSYSPCTTRGGSYSNNVIYTSFRIFLKTTVAEEFSFRPIIYIEEL